MADFATWLTEGGWQVETEVEWTDVVATRGSERLVGEAKGVTSSPGLDVDTLYGQLLRRMTTPDGHDPVRRDRPAPSPQRSTPRPPTCPSAPAYRGLRRG